VVRFGRKDKFINSSSTIIYYSNFFNYKIIVIMITDCKVGIGFTIEAPGSTGGNDFKVCAWDRPVRCGYPGFLVIVAIISGPTTTGRSRLGSFGYIVLAGSPFIKGSPNVSDDPISCTTVVI